MRFSEGVESLLITLRQHPHFPDLLKAVERPKLPEFRKSQAENVETARAEWIFESGRRDQHDRWLWLLTGKAPEQGED